MSKIPPEKLLIGAHTSAAGGAPAALLEGESIGATTIQLFTSNQKQWHPRQISEEEIREWERIREELGFKQIMSHDSYLINLGSPHPESVEKSLAAFKAEIQRCFQLGIELLNFHPGAALTGTEEDCLNQIVKSLSSFEPIFQETKIPTRLLMETTSGQGTTVGHRFEHLGFLIKELESKIPIGICIDTCHIFAAGYDIRTREGWEEVLALFDEKIGLKHLYAFHINDSENNLGSRVDRHAPLGKGKIGLSSFEFLMKHPLFRSLPKYLETPKYLDKKTEKGPIEWKREIALLRQLAT